LFTVIRLPMQYVRYYLMHKQVVDEYTAIQVLKVILLYMKKTGVKKSVKFVHA